MLILSQDGLKLVNISQASAVQAQASAAQAFSSSEECGIKASFTGSSCWLGGYASQERCAAILGEIAACYAQYSRRYGGDCAEFAVYRMPEE